MKGIIKLASIFYLVLNSSGCAGGTQGTGVRPEKQLVDRPAVSQEATLFGSLLNMPKSVESDCKISQRRWGSLVRIHSDLGDAKLLSQGVGKCVFELPIQGSKFEAEFDRIKNPNAEIKYLLNEISCKDDSVKNLSQVQAINLKDGKLPLVNFHIDSQHKYEFVFESVEFEEGKVTLQLQSDSINLCKQQTLKEK